MSIRARLTLFSGLMLAALALGALPSTSEAQFGKRLKDAVKRTAEDKAIQKATTEESKGIDGAMEGGGRQGRHDRGLPPAAPAAATTTGAPAPAADAGATAAVAAPPKTAGEGAFLNFDFVPGDRVLFYDDYASDNVGDFPRRLGVRGGQRRDRRLGRGQVAAREQVDEILHRAAGGRCLIGSPSSSTT